MGEVYNKISTDVCKGFHYFYEIILPKALFSPDINEENLGKAFLWAEFCEKIYEKLDEESIKKLNEFLKVQSKKFKVHENLNKCSQILCHTLLQNPNINRRHLELFMTTTRSNVVFTEILDEDVELKSLGINLIESLKPLKMKESERSLYYEIKSELFLEFIKEFADQLASEGQFEVHFNLLFDTLCDSKDTMEVLLYLLLRKDVPRDIYAFVIHWVLLRIVEDRSCSLALFLWKQNPSLLRTIAVNSPDFFSYYLNSLTKFTSPMQLTYENGQHVWKVLNSIKQRHVPTLTYEDIINHFDILTSINDDVTQKSVAHIRKMTVSEADRVIWKEILNAIT